MMKRHTIIFMALVGAAMVASTMVSCTTAPDASIGAVTVRAAELAPLAADTVAEQRRPPRMPRPGDPGYRFPSVDSLRHYVDSGARRSKYAGGIMSVIAREVPEYAERLIADGHHRFVVVDKVSMRVLLYDHYGHELRAYDMCCARNYGTKHERSDCRTPEGFFTIQGIYDSTDWLYTDDEGNTSPIKGQYGPRFIRIKAPVTSSIGIHGTCAPWSIGHRTSHGCIRVANDDIIQLASMVTPGMVVIVLPGRKDRAVNREEGCRVPYFPTAPKYAMSSAERL